MRLVPLFKWCFNCVHCALSRLSARLMGFFLHIYIVKLWRWTWILRPRWACKTPIWAVVPPDCTPRGEVRDKWICGCCTASMWKAPQWALTNQHFTSTIGAFDALMLFLTSIYTQACGLSRFFHIFFWLCPAWELLLLCKCRVWTPWTGFIVWSSLVPPVRNIPGCVLDDGMHGSQITQGRAAGEQKEADAAAHIRGKSSLRLRM